MPRAISKIRQAETRIVDLEANAEALQSMLMVLKIKALKWEADFYEVKATMATQDANRLKATLSGAMEAKKRKGDGQDKTTS